jgi:ComF family protein
MRAMRMVHALKYSFVTRSVPALAELMAEAWIHVWDDTDFLFVPIPLHPRRMKERGFNQASLLARECACLLGCASADDVLLRTRWTPPQTELARKDRYANIRDAFSCPHPEAVCGANILLIDDVFTTGATLQEAARELKTNGAREIRALTLAHG